MLFCKIFVKKPSNFTITATRTFSLASKKSKLRLGLLVGRLFPWSGYTILYVAQPLI